MILSKPARTVAPWCGGILFRTQQKISQKLQATARVEEYKAVVIRTAERQFLWPLREASRDYYEFRNEVKFNN